MTHRDFCYWLKGFFELRTANGQALEPLTQNQLDLIQKHLNLAIGPSAFGPDGPKVGPIGPTGPQC